MNIAIMQPYFFPYLGYFQLLSNCDEFILLTEVNYIKRGWIHRNRIKMHERETRFGLNISEASQNKKINEHQIHSGKEEAKRKVFNAYKNSKNFDQWFPTISNAIMHPCDSLSDYLANSLFKTSLLLDIDTKIIKDSDIEYDRTKRGSNLILEICRSRRASTYINLPGGKDIYNSQDFLAEGIELCFMKEYNPANYKHLDPNFSCLSVVDKLACVEIETLRKVAKERSFEKSH